MTVQIFVTNERLPFLLDMPVKVVVLKTERNMTMVEVTITSQYDILEIFHAGVMCGINCMTSKNIAA